MSVRILQGDCRDVLATLPSASVNCCITSPPYFGLRDYGVDGQIGLEATPDAFVAELVAVFREVRRALRDDGTLWLNLGDSYAGSWGARGRGDGTNAPRADLEGKHGTAAPNRHGFAPWGVKNKDLMLMPARVALALQADGWYLRQDIIWSKPNPMPESVTDRCTKAHEYVFLLSKSPRYYFDADAIAEPSIGRSPGNIKPQKGEIAYAEGDEKMRTRAGLTAYAGRHRSQRDSFKRENSKRAEVFPGQSMGTHRPDREESAYPLDTRNKRSVWTIAPAPFKEAHFATFPPALVEPCILAGCPIDGMVLDPFGGAGTTGLVADRLQRNAILIELNPEYSTIARNRINGDSPLFGAVA